MFFTLNSHVNTDRDNITNKKIYTTYAKFVYYADKMINDNIQKQIKPELSIIDKLLAKRDMLITAIDNKNLSINQRNELIKDIASKKLMFKDKDGKNLLTPKEYEILDKFGFYDFLNENKNYKIKEQLELALKEQVGQKKQLLQLNNNAKI